MEFKHSGYVTLVLAVVAVAGLLLTWSLDGPDATPSEPEPIQEAQVRDERLPKMEFPEWVRRTKARDEDEVESGPTGDEVAQAPEAIEQQAPPGFETAFERMARLGRHLDGAEYVQLRYTLSPEGIGGLLKDPNYNPGGQQVSEELKETILERVKEANVSVASLSDMRREVEYHLVRDLLATGQAESGTPLGNGMMQAPRSNSPEQRIRAVMSGGKSGFIRMRPGLSFNRDSILSQECEILAQLELEVMALLISGG